MTMMTRTFAMATVAMLSFAVCAANSTWTGDAGNGVLTDTGNWNSAPASDSICYITTDPGLPLTIDTKNFFDGAMIRYNGKFVVTNDFGAGNALTNVGLNAESAFHVEGGATVVHKSGGIVAHKGTKFDGTYISNNSTFIIDGADAWFEQKGGYISIRGSGNSAPVSPKLFVTNGASLTLANTLAVGSGGYPVRGYAYVAGAGTKVSANDINIGSSSAPGGRPDCTNLMVVADSACVTARRNVSVGTGLCYSELHVVGGFLTVTNNLNVGYEVNSSNSFLHVLSGGSVTTRSKTLIGHGHSVDGSSARACVSGAGSSLVSMGDAFVTGGVFRVEDGGSVCLSNRLTAADSRIEAYGEGAAFVASIENQMTTTTGGGTNVFSASHGASMRFGATGFNAWGECDMFSATDGASITVPRLRGCYNVVVEGEFNYLGNIYLDGSDSDRCSLTFTNATVTGARIEMTRPSTIRLFNTHLSVTNGIFMMGDGSGQYADNNAFERHVYVGGTDTWVRVTQSNGFYVRGENTTIHVEVPAEGFSTTHPVFDLPKINFESGHHIRVAVTADPALMRKGGTYTLFRTSADQSCHSDGLEWIYDPDIITIDTSVSHETRIRVKRCGGMIIFR